MIHIAGGLPAATQFPNSLAPMLPEDHGLTAWSVPIDAAAATSAMSALGAGVLFLTMIRRIPRATVTNVHVHVATAGATLSNCFGALFTTAGALLAQTADQSTAWQSSGFKTMALSGGPISFTGGDLYAGLWYNGTTAPTLLRSGSGVGGSSTVGQTSGTFNAASANTGLTTTAPSTLGAQTAIAVRYWVGLS